MRCTGLSIRFEEGGDILKVDGHGDRRPPTGEILKSRVSQVPFPAFSRGIPTRKKITIEEQKTFNKSTFAVSSSCACNGYRSPNTI